MTAAGLSAAAGLAGGGMKLLSGFTGAQGAEQTAAANAQAANYQAAVASNNAIVAGQQADYAVAAGVEKAGTESLKGAATVGTIKANQAGSGIDVNRGTAVDVQAGARSAGELNSETVLNNAELSAYGYRSQQTNFQAESRLKTLEAGNDVTAGGIAATGDIEGGFGGLLSSASSIPTKFGGGSNSTAST